MPAIPNGQLLAVPTYQIILELRPFKIVEIGAGSGFWMRILREGGVNIIGYDPAARPGMGVRKGDHRKLADHPDRIPLIVWPPDGTDLNEWLAPYAGSMVAICGRDGRFKWPSAEWEAEREAPGEGGISVFRFGILNAVKGKNGH